jgi:dTDP-4-dehydrorhamnose 3,5-epimerase
MTFTDTDIPGVLIVDSDVFSDERGTFTRAWMPEEFRAHGLETRIAQCSMASNRRKGTIRGLHYQVAPFEEVKLIRAVRGSVFDVAVDLRPDSPTYGRWTGVTLSADNRRMLYVPRGMAHGYQTLTDFTEVFYFVSAPYSPDHQRGLRWNDPRLKIDWPLGSPTVVSDRDARFADFEPSRGAS